MPHLCHVMLARSTAPLTLPMHALLVQQTLFPTPVLLHALPAHKEHRPMVEWAKHVALQVHYPFTTHVARVLLPLLLRCLHHRMIAVMLPLQLQWYVVSIVVAFVVDVVFVLALIVFFHYFRLHVLRNSPGDVLQAHSVAPER